MHVLVIADICYRMVYLIVLRAYSHSLCLCCQMAIARSLVVLLLSVCIVIRS
jgi:hypothetical protein